MADVKISALPVAGAIVPSTNVLPVVNGGITAKATVNTLVNAVLSASPTLVTPILGTPTSGNALNISNLQANQITNIATVTSGTTLTGAEFVLISQGGNTRKTTVDNISTHAAGDYLAVQGNNTQTSAGATSANVMELETTDISNGITVELNSDPTPIRTEITFSRTGVYNLQFSAQFSRTGGTGFSTASVWLKKGGVNVAGTNGQINVPQSGGKSIASWNYVLSINAAEYLELYWSSADTGMTLEATGTQTNPTRPSTPSIIVTVTQVA
jgi:hypothetical protein